MQRSWWKILSCALILYTVIVGLQTPLAPGIESVDPRIISSSNHSISITGYNTHFKEVNVEDIQVWMENENGQEICSSAINPTSNNELIIAFSKPEIVNSKLFNLFINNSIDGTLLYEGMSFKDIPLNENETFQSDCKRAISTIHFKGFSFPFLKVLYETIRNLMFHVPMWFTMIILMLISSIFGVKYLSTNKLKDDIRSEAAVYVGLLFAILGLVTGSIWAKYTWGAWWTNDPKLNGAAVSTLIYFAYIVLRRSINDVEKRGRIAAVYNIFAFVMFIVLIMVYPRINQGLHPGMEGNPAFSNYDLDDHLRMVFYPAVLGFILLGIWIFDLRSRISFLNLKQNL